MLLPCSRREGQLPVAQETSLLSGPPCLWGPLLAGPCRWRLLQQQLLLLLGARCHEQGLMMAQVTRLVVSG